MSRKKKEDDIDAEILALADFFRQRLVELRINKGVSEIQMSYSLGNSKNYIHHVCAGISLPSMIQFFNICNYLEISPAEYFDPGIKNPTPLNELTKKLKKLNLQELEAVTNIVDIIIQDRKGSADNDNG